MNKQDFFIAKYDIDGNFKWANQAYADMGYGRNVVVDDKGGVYATGWFSGSATFGSFNVNSYTSKDAFVARYDSIGNCIGVIHFGKGEGWGICLDSIGDLCISGTFEDTVTFGSQTFASYGMEDFFVAKLDAITGNMENKPPNNQLLIYANPTQGKCNITIPDEFANDKQLTLTVYDNIGREIQVQTITMHEGKIKLNLSAEAKGMYHVSLSNGKKSFNGKIVFE